MAKTNNHHGIRDESLDHTATLKEQSIDNPNESSIEAIQDVVNDVLERSVKFGFNPDEDMIFGAVEESANLLKIDLTEAQITEACERVMKPRKVSNYIEQPDRGQSQEPSLNTDPNFIEAKVMKDYAHFLGKDVLVNRVCGYVGDDSSDTELSPPAKVRVEATSEQSLKRWIDGWCDPLYEVALVEEHPQLKEVRSLWIHGPSLHLNGKQTEASDIVSIADPQTPREVLNYTDPNQVYETGSDDTFWNSKVIRVGERFNVQVFDADGDRRPDREDSFADQTLAIAFAYKSVQRYSGREVQGKGQC